MSDIKPIETVYKGYKFRSRLEARWAIVLDALGLKSGEDWFYENEGYDLGGDWYLPDFWLPKIGVYLEVKPPEPRRECLKFYLAGKIGWKDWRHELVPNLSGNNAAMSPLDMYCGHCYVGPFFSSYGHGCDHGPSTHGDIDSYSGDRTSIFDACLEQIAECDVVFAWIDELTCFGTLVEIGYASALKKRIIIGYSQSVRDELDRQESAMESSSSFPHKAVSAHDFWFMEECAESARCYASATSAIRVLFPGPSDDAAFKARKLAAASRKNVILIRGNPDSQHQEYQAELYRSVGEAVGRRLAFRSGTQLQQHFACLHPKFCYPKYEDHLRQA